MTSRRRCTRRLILLGSAAAIIAGLLVFGAPGPFAIQPAGADPSAFKKGVVTIAGGGDPATTERGCETYGPPPPANCAEAGLVDGAGPHARFSSPFDVALAPDQRSLFVSDQGNDAIRRVDLVTREVTTCARGGDLYRPTYLSVDDAGTLYVVSQVADASGASDPNTKILRMAGCGEPEVLVEGVRNVGGIAWAGGRLWAAVANEPWLAQGGVLVGLDPSGRYEGKESLPEAVHSWGWNRFWYPRGVAAYPNGDLYLDGVRVDPRTREATELPHLTGSDVAITSRGQLYLSHGGSCPDWGSYVAAYRASVDDRRIVAGVNGPWGGGYDDGAPGALCNPSGLAASADGSSLFVADQGNHAIRQIKVTRPTRYRFGAASAFGLAADPVNTSTGNYVEQHADLPAPTGTFGMAWTRTYNHQDDEVRGLGRGWSHAFDERIASGSVTDDLIEYRAADGRAHLFERASGSGERRWLPVDGIRGELRAAASSDELSLQLWSGERREFDASGRLIRACEGRVDWASAGDGWCRSVGPDDRRQVVDVTWDGDRLATATSSTGYGVSFGDDDGDGGIDRVTTSDGRSMRYERDPARPDLLSVVRGPVDGMATRYIADDRGRVREVWTSGQQGELPVLVNEYDDQDRVVVQYSDPVDPTRPDPGGDRASFGYDQPEPGQTAVTHDDRQGSSETVVYVHDEEGLLIRLTDPLGHDVTRAWQQEQLAEVTDRDDATYRNTYDRLGRLCKRWLTDAATGGIGAFESYRYEGQAQPCDGGGDSPRLVEHVDVTGTVTRYEYDDVDEGIPSRVIEAAGTDVEAVTRIESDRGVVHRSTDPDGIVTEHTWDETSRRLVATTVGGATTWFGYDAAGRQNVVRSPLGNESWTVFDAAGRPVEQIGPVHVDRECTPGGCAFGAPPTGDEVPRTRTEYGPDGSVRAFTDADGRTWTYESERLPAGGLERRTIDPDGFVTVSRHDAAGRLVTSTAPADPGDPPGSSTTTRYEYGALGRLVRTIDPTGRQTHHCYDRAGRVVLTASGQLADGEPIDCATPQPGLQWSTASYDRRGRVTSTVSGASASEPGLETRFVYDEADRLVELIGPAAPSMPVDQRPRTVTAHDPRGRPARTTDSDGHTRETHYTRAGKVAGTVDLATGLGTTHLYDPESGVLAEVRGPVADPAAPDAPTTRYEHDGDGRVTRVIHPDGTSTETMAYDASGRVLASRDPGDVVTAFTWTRAGHLASQVTAPGTGAEVAVRYEAHRFDGQVEQVRDGNGRVTSYGYSARGERVSRTDALGNVERWEHDTARREVRRVDPLGRATTTSYDEHGRPVEVLAPDGRVTRTEWSAGGQPLRILHENGAERDTVAFTYDELGRRASMDDATGTTTYRHDSQGRLVAMLAPGGRATAWSYDEAGRRSSTTVPDGTVLDYEYDPVSGHLSTVSPRHRVADTFTAPDGSAVDKAKWSTSASSASGAVAVHEAAAQLLVGATGGVAQLQFRAAPKLADSSTALRYSLGDARPDAQLVVFARQGSSKSYRLVVRPDRTTAELWRTTGGTSAKLGDLAVSSADGWQRLRLDVQGTNVRARTWSDGTSEPSTWGVDVVDSAVGGTGQVGVALIAPEGAEQSVLVDDVTVTDRSVADPTPLVAYTWDRGGRVRSETSPVGTRDWSHAGGRITSMSQTVVGAPARTEVAYDEAGRVARETVDGVVTSYGYDGAGQLTSISRPDGIERYDYDEVGRRRSKSVGDLTTTYRYDAADQLLSTSGASVSTYTWDGAGRMTSARSGSTTTTFRYDAAGRLRTTKRGSSQATRTVDGLGTPTAVTNGTGATTYLDWDPTLAVPRVSQITSSTLGSVVLANDPGRPSAVHRGDDSESLPIDARGSVLKTGATSGLAASTGYDPFGVPATNVAVTDVRLSYRGELAESGQLHLRARQYNPSTGSFTSIDPLDGVDGTPTVTNPYHYADNDPINNVDPTGLRPGDALFQNECSASTLTFWFPVDPRHRWLGEVHVAGFIPQYETSLTPLNGPGPRYFLGDNRRFTPEGVFIRPENNRFFARLDFATGSGFAQVNPTHRSDAEILLAAGGVVGTAYAMLADWGRCSSGLPISYGEFDGNNFLASSYDRNYMVMQRFRDTYRFRWSVVQADQGFGQDLLRPRADGVLDFTFLDDGRAVQPSWSGDCFPSLEVMRVVGSSARTTQVIGRVSDTGALAMTGGMTSIYHLLGRC